MNKNFLSLAGIALLITSISIGYYFFFYLPEKNMMTYKLECTRLAQKEFEKLKEETDSENHSILQPEYKLDEQGRCLYKVHEFVSTEDKISDIRYVTDLFTNQTVIELFNWRDNLSEDVVMEYEKQEEKLFK